MANARALDKRRKSIRNIRKITRTMELIATARFKKAMDRAAAWLLAFVPVLQEGWLRNAAVIWSGTIVLAYADLTVAQYLPVYAALTAAALVRSGSRSADPSERRMPQTDT